MLPCGQKSPIPNGHRLWRRVQDDLDHLEWDSNLGCWWPRPVPPSNAVQFHDDGMSTVWVEHADLVHAAPPETALLGAPSPSYTLVYELPVTGVRHAGAAVEHTPVAEQYPECAHTSVLVPVAAAGKSNAAKSERKAIRYALSRLMLLVHGTPTVQPPPNP